MNRDEMEQALRPVAAEALNATAAEFSDSLDAADQITAALFRVSSIASMWRRHAGPLLGRLADLFARSAEDQADDLGETLPDVSAALDAYMAVTGPLVEAVGETLRDAAVAVVAEGLNSGWDVEQLRDALRETFLASNYHLGEGRADLIAMTEATRAYNSGRLAAAQALSHPDRPLIKQWVTKHDTRVREAHRMADGQIQLLDDPFDVGGYPMRYPGDPVAPADLTIGCRCVMRTELDERTASMDPDTGDELQSGMPGQLRRYWISGAGAAKIRWGTPGDFDRCVRALRGKFPQDPEGLCANLHHEALGKWPGQESVRDMPGQEASETTDYAEAVPPMEYAPKTISWSTPDSTALAFENQTTGDGRAFTPGALHWGNGPWPLMYTSETGSGHEGAELAGTILSLGREGDRITGTGLLYTGIDAGQDAAELLSYGAPLGVSLDLDDVTAEVVELVPGETPLWDDDEAVYSARFTRASAIPLPGGGWVFDCHTEPHWTASGQSAVSRSEHLVFHVGPDGRVPGTAFDLSAAAGETAEGGTVLETTSQGDHLMRITSARVRGATLVPIPAFADARIVLDVAYIEPGDEAVTADAAHSDYDRVVRHVRKAPAAVTALEVAAALKMRPSQVRRHMATAAKKGHIVRITRGRYQAAPSVTASVTGGRDLPIADRDTPWDGQAATTRVKNWAAGDADRLARAFLWRDDSKDASNVTSYKLGFADVVGGELTMIPRGVFAVAAVLEGARGGTDIPQADQEEIRGAVSGLYSRMADKFKDPSLVAPWDAAHASLDADDDLIASAWTAVRTAPPLPASWFADPVADGSLSDTSPGVNYDQGRVFGWIAKSGVPHASFGRKNLTIDKISDQGLSFSNFLRQPVELDNGRRVNVGPLTANVGHDRDSAECGTVACQFDSSRTVMAIVTVGMSPGGLWFSGALMPDLSERDFRIFTQATNPSYHLTKNREGSWDFRAALMVPVPGHPTPLLASAVHRANLALTAAAQMAEVDDAVAEAERVLAQPATHAGFVDALTAALASDSFIDTLSAALKRAEDRKAAEAAELEALLAEGRSLSASGYDDGVNTSNGTEEV